MFQTNSVKGEVVLIEVGATLSTGLGAMIGGCWVSDGEGWKKKGGVGAEREG